jgi:hypothetical protein
LTKLMVVLFLGGNDFSLSDVILLIVQSLLLSHRVKFIAVTRLMYMMLVHRIDISLSSWVSSLSSMMRCS